MSFDRIRVAYSPALAVLVAHEHLAIIANLPRDTARFCCHAGFAVVRLLRPVLSHSDLRTSAEPGRMKWSSTFSFVLLSPNHSWMYRSNRGGKSTPKTRQAGGIAASKGGYS